MPNELLPTLLLQILVIGYTPGPANIYSLSMSLRHGRRKALKMWLGLLTGFSIAVMSMATLTHLIGMAFGEYIIYLKYVGAAYIAYLAYRIFRNRHVAEAADKDCNFRTGLIVQLTNAKMLLFDLTAFNAFVLPYSNQFHDLVEVAAWLVLAGPGGNLAWLIAGSYLRRFFVNYGRQVDIVSSIALLFCALYILIG